MGTPQELGGHKFLSATFCIEQASSPTNLYFKFCVAAKCEHELNYAGTHVQMNKGLEKVT